MSKTKSDFTEITNWAYQAVDHLVWENKANIHCIQSSGSNKLESIGVDRGGLAWLISKAIYEYEKYKEFQEKENATNCTN